ncbi:MAG: hypothetical protein V1742_10075, partial [Pseudomonadota bacterium]
MISTGSRCLPNPEMNYRRLFVTALLSLRPGLSDPVRASVIARAAALDIQDEAELALAAAGRLVADQGRPPFRPTISQVTTARDLARQWVEQKVSVITVAQVLSAQAAKKPEPRILFVWGNPDNLALPKAAVLNSRKSRQITPGDRWIAVTQEMAGLACRQGYVLVSSLGNYSYELVCFLAGKTSGLVVVNDGPLPQLQPPERREVFFQ